MFGADSDAGPWQAGRQADREMVFLEETPPESHGSSSGLRSQDG